MRSEPNIRIEQYRVDFPAPSPAGVNWGMFIIPVDGRHLTVMSSGTDTEHGWEHVSVSTHFRTPTWEEMDAIREMFWRDDEAVFQFHPPKQLKVNFHQHCLHLWKPLNALIILPPAVLIGPVERAPG